MHIMKKFRPKQKYIEIQYNLKSSVSKHGDGDVMKRGARRCTTAQSSTDAVFTPRCCELATTHRSVNVTQYDDGPGRVPADVDVMRDASSVT